MRRRLDTLAEVAQEILTGEVTMQTSRHTPLTNYSHNNEVGRNVANDSESSSPMVDNDPWDRIPDHRWDRRAVKCLWEGLTDPEIAKTLDGLDAKTVTNRLSTLRRLYPDHVPTRGELRKRRGLSKLG